MSGFSDIQIINWALDIIPAKGISARTDANESARSANRFYDMILTLCLRRGLTPWPFATKRVSLSPTNNTPVNQFACEFNLPGDCLAIQQFWPTKVPYRKEDGKLYTDATTCIIKYTSNEVLSKPWLMDIDFMEYFATSLAAAMAPKLSEDTNRTKMLKQDSEVAFRHAASAFSMEDTPDKVMESPWIESHEGIANYVARTDGLLDFNSIP